MEWANGEGGCAEYLNDLLYSSMHQLHPCIAGIIALRATSRMNGNELVSDTGKVELLSSLKHPK